MVKSSILVAAVLLLLHVPALARDDDTAPELVNVRDIRSAALEAAAVPADTTWILGGPGTLTGKFEDAQGQPDWQGWTSIDRTQATETHWSVSNFNAADLDTSEADNHAWWCGDLFTACMPDDPPEGVGNGWAEPLRWSATVPDPSLDCTVRVRAVLNVDLEPGEDYLHLQALTVDHSFNMIDFSGRDIVEQIDVSRVLTPADYLGENGDEIHLRWLLTTDGAWSDEDCLWPTAGGCQIDRISVTFDQGAGEVLVGQVETCEPGDPLQWVPTPLQGVGDFAQVWPLLDDLDPDADNGTPQVAFIDDGIVVPGTGGSSCITWCYGPGGHIVNTGWGIAEFITGIENEIRSPILALPPGDLGGAMLAFDVYVHAELEAGGAYIFPTWHVRSTDDPAGSDGWSGWRTHMAALWGPPTYARPFHNVTDLLVPDATHVQIALGVRNIYPSLFDDGTPAPYFDNVAFMVHDDPSPAVLHVQADGAGEYATIQLAIHAAAPGDTVLLADGIYTGDGNRDLQYQGKAIVIASASGDPAACIIDSEGSDGDPHRAFYLTQTGGPGSVLAGVTVRGGYERRGGGVYVRDSGITLQRCVFTANKAAGVSYRDGGAVFGEDAVIILSDCVIDGNEAELGAGIATKGATSLEVTGSLFTANRAWERGAGIFADDESTVTVDGCTFAGNRDQLNLGIITAEGSSHVQITGAIVAFSQVGRAVYCNEAGHIDLACSDLFGNQNGDWTGCVSDQLGIEGNISADPLFCLDEHPADPYTIDTGSPCAPEAQPICGLIGARPTACTNLTGVPDGAAPPSVTRLLPSFPNPFNPRTRIRFELAARSRVELAVFDLRGRRVRSLVDSWLPAGDHDRTWDGRTDRGRTAASGTYVVRLITGDHIGSRRITLLK